MSSSDKIGLILLGAAVVLPLAVKAITVIEDRLARRECEGAMSGMGGYVGREEDATRRGDRRGPPASDNAVHNPVFDRETPREKLLRQLQAMRDQLCLNNAGHVVTARTDRYVSGYLSGYGAGVEAMWKAAEDAVNALPVESITE